MLNPLEENLLTWLVEFQQKGGNQITLARKDVAVIVSLLKRNVEPMTAVDVPATKAPPVVTDIRARTTGPNAPRVCIDCGKPFTVSDPMRCAVVGKGPLHGACADKRGLHWRNGAL